MEGVVMRDWMDFDGDGDVDIVDMLIAEDLLRADEEKHTGLSADYDEDDEDEEDEDELEAALLAAGIDPLDLRFMDPDERTEALEEAGLDPDDYEFY